MASNNQPIILTNEQDSVPRSSAGTGTITSYGSRIVGVGTSFSSELNNKDWIYIPGNNELVQVRNIVSDTELSLYNDVSTPLSGSAFRITPDSRYSMVSYLVTGAGAGIIDGESFSQNEGNTYERQGDHGKVASGDYVHPIDFDASTNSTTIKITTKTG